MSVRSAAGIIVCALCALQNVSARSAPGDAQKTSSQIRVMLVDTSGTLYVQPKGQWQIRDENKAVQRLTPGIVAQLSLQDDRLVLSTTASATTTSFGLAKGKPVVLESVSAAPAETDRISIGATRGRMYDYVGSIALRSGEKRGLEAVTTMPLEEYLRGVVPSEIGNTSPMQAMCAQAVAARSFAVIALRSRKHEGGNYDICSSVHCQVYSGLSKCNAATDEAVRQTNGVILMFDGKPMPAFYSSMCGGHSEDIRHIWSERSSQKAYHDNTAFDGPEKLDFDLTKDADFRKYLAAKPAVYCNPEKFKVVGWAGGNYRWHREFTAEEVSQFVAEKKDIGRVTAIRPGTRGKSGRYNGAEFVGEKGKFSVGTEIELRRLFQPALRSGAFALDTVGPADRPERFVLNGTGSGHGVGMCQTGAMGMANAGMTFREILTHYYPKATIEKMDQ